LRPTQSRSPCCDKDAADLALDDHPASQSLLLEQPICSLMPFAYALSELRAFEGHLVVETMIQVTNRARQERGRVAVYFVEAGEVVGESRMLDDVLEAKKSELRDELRSQMMS
jgi:hypothetical protein